MSDEASDAAPADYNSLAQGEPRLVLRPPIRVDLVDAIAAVGRGLPSLQATAEAVDETGSSSGRSYDLLATVAGREHAVHGLLASVIPPFADTALWIEWFLGKPGAVPTEIAMPADVQRSLPYHVKRAHGKAHKAAQKLDRALLLRAQIDGEIRDLEEQVAVEEHQCKALILAALVRRLEQVMQPARAMGQAWPLLAAIASANEPAAILRNIEEAALHPNFNRWMAAAIARVAVDAIRDMPNPSGSTEGMNGSADSVQRRARTRMRTYVHQKPRGSQVASAQAAGKRPVVDAVDKISRKTARTG